MGPQSLTVKREELRADFGDREFTAGDLVQNLLSLLRRFKSLRAHGAQRRRHGPPRINGAILKRLVLGEGHDHDLRLAMCADEQCCCPGLLKPTDPISEALPKLPDREHLWWKHHAEHTTHVYTSV